MFICLKKFCEIMPMQQLPCVTKLCDSIEVRFVEGESRPIEGRIIEMWLYQENIKTGWLNFENYKKEERIPLLYEKMKKSGYKLPSLERFTKEFLQILQNYRDGKLPMPEPIVYKRGYIY